MIDKEVSIIGAGPSGISAALYLKRAGIPFLLFEKNIPGGKIAFTSYIDNYPGYKNRDGVELALQMQEQLAENEIEITFDSIENITKENERFLLKGNKETYLSKYILLATGTKEKRIGLQGEERFYGKGISYCALCDGALYKNKEVAVLGGGNSALEESLYLSSIVSKVYLIHRREEFRAEEELIKKVKQKENIVLYTSYQIEKLYGTKFLEGIEVVSSLKEEKEFLPISGLFVYIGFEPSFDIVSFPIETEDGYIKTDEDMETSVARFFAIGDVRKKRLRQIVTAVSDGAIAATKIGNLRNEEYKRER